MSFLFILIGVTILTVVILTVTMVFGYQKHTFFRKVIATGLTLSVILSLFSVFYSSEVRGSIKDLSNTYQDLNLYQSTIESSYNEYVRYNFYEKVTSYNESYMKHQKKASGKWFGSFYPKDWDANIDLIDFQLHDDYYYFCE